MSQLVPQQKSLLGKHHKMSYSVDFYRVLTKRLGRVPYSVGDWPAVLIQRPELLDASNMERFCVFLF